MRDWGWQDRAEWSAQNGYGRDESRRRNHFGGAQKAPVWGEWEGVVEEFFGTSFWELYVTRMESMRERKEEKEWGDKVADLLPLIIKLTDEIGRTPVVEGAIQRLMGRKPKSRVAMASGELVAAWRTMAIEEILDDVRTKIEEARCASFDVVAEAPTQNTRVACSGTIPQNNPFAALKGKF